MKEVKISDQTLCAASALRFKEKLELARHFETAGVDLIELPALTGLEADALTVRTLASLLREAALSISAGLTEETARAAWEAVGKAEKARLRVSLPVSPAGMEYLCGLKAPQALERVSAQVAFCAGLCPEVEFAAEDATRAEEDFLAEAIRRAIASGATTVTVCDTAGLLLPEELSALLCRLREAVPELASVRLAVDCADDMGLAAACACAALAAGASEIKTRVGGARPALGTVAQFFRLRGDRLGYACALDMTGIVRCLQKIEALLAAGTRRETPYDAGAPLPETSEGLSLTGGADEAAVDAAARSLGYSLDAEDLRRVREAVLRIAARKSVGARELDAIIAGAAQQVPSTYQVQRYVVNSGNVISATAHVELLRGETPLSGLSAGDGPIDAAFLAIEQIIGHRYELDDFQIQAVTEGREAMGFALVKLRCEGVLYSGEGLSTDVIGAAIHAYVNAVNKIVYKGEQA